MLAYPDSAVDGLKRQTKMMELDGDGMRALTQIFAGHWVLLCGRNSVQMTCFL